MTGAMIVSACRTAVVPRGGSFSALQPHQLAAPVILECLERAGIAPEDVDELIVGNALGAGGNQARIVALASGLPLTVGGLTIDRQCSSGLDAMILAGALINSGQANIVIAGGTESYSRRPLRLRTFSDGTPPQPYDQAPFTPWPDRDPDMAQAADGLASRFGVSRHEQDDWAILSHQKATNAKHLLLEELVSVAGITHDQFTRNLSPELCARSRSISGTVTAANMSVAADAAAFCVIVSEEVVRTLATPAVRLVHGCTRGGDPEYPGLAPVAAIEEVQSKARVKNSDLVCAEIMEAFAVQAIVCVREAGLDPETTNRGGGSLARGHPIGASGAILAVRLFHELSRSHGFGLAAIASAGGLGTAVLLDARV